jgi:alpha-glucuronidase
MLFFHHLPYPHAHSNGKTIIQSIYDSHYEGAAKAAEFVTDWESLKGRIDPKLYADVLPRLEYQAGHAIVWRDAVVQYFHKLSGLPDEENRAGNYPGRLEAESARLTGYNVIDITPWEDASMGKAVSCQGGSACSAEWTFNGKPGTYNIAVQYFDLRDGAAKFTLRLNGQSIAAWPADASLPSIIPNGDNSTRHTIRSVALKPGDVLRVEGTPDGKDPAALDYIELTPAASLPPS